MLNGLVEQIQSMKAAASTPVITFDLDGTLMDNRPRLLTIMRELADHWSDKHPDATAKLRNAKMNGVAYGFVDNLRRLGIDAPALLDWGFDFWHERFFADAYLGHDTAVPGAVDFARRCHSAGATLVYLTGRDLPNMALGTFASLRDLGFPIGVIGTELVTKPDFDTPDVEFKQSVADDLHRLGEMIAVFDNEPGNCNILLDAHPKCVSVLVDTLCAPEPPELRPQVRVIETFEV
jgi:hypothetical protein